MKRKLTLTLAGLAAAAVLLGIHPYRATTPKEPAQLDTSSSESAVGCSFSFNIFASAYQTFLFSCVYSNAINSYNIVPYGYTGSIYLSDGDTVTFQRYSACPLPTLNWGYTVWTHCLVADAAVLHSMPANAQTAIYRAHTTCHCPDAGSGTLDLIKTVECTGQ